MSPPLHYSMLPGKSQSNLDVRRTFFPISESIGMFVVYFPNKIR